MSLAAQYNLPTFALYISKPKPIIESLCSRHIVEFIILVYHLTATSTFV